MMQIWFVSGAAVSRQAVEQLIRSVTFSSSAETTPASPTRTVVITLNDGVHKVMMALEGGKEVWGVPHGGVMGRNGG